MIVSSFDLSFIVLNIFRVYIIYRFMKVFYERSIRPSWMELIGYGAYYFVITIAYLSLRLPLFMLVINIIFLFGLTYLYETKRKSRIISTVSIYLIFLAVETGVVYLTGYMDLDYLTETTYDSGMGYALIQVVTFLVAILCEKFVNIKKGLNITYQYLISLLLLPFTSIFLILCLYNTDFETRIPIVGGSFLLLFCNICVLYLYDEIARQGRERAQYLIQSKEVESIQKQLDLLAISYDNIRKVKHDLKNHLHTLKNLGLQDRKSEFQKYIEEILKHGDVKEHYIHTGNVTADGILNLKIMEAKKYGIQVSKMILLPEQLNISSYDWTVILGNLLDNAIEAVKPLKEEKRWIDINLTYKQESIIISISNSFSGELTYENKDMSKLRTTKKGEQAHGIGLDNVKNTIKNYHGTMSIQHENQIFYVNIILYFS